MPRINPADPRQYLLERCTPAASGCWEWTRSAHPLGYGSAWFANERISAHRLSYRSFVGPIDGHHVCHRCDNPRCINPDHLFLGTHADNMRDKARKGRTGKEKRQGERNVRSKLSEQAIQEILSSAETGGALARKYGVSRTLVNMVRRREIWRHI